jgi:cytochrome c oxidase assembly protein subunit 11
MTSIATRNARTAGMAALLVAAMVGLAFASVPLYRLFCQVTGFGGTPVRSSHPSGTMAPTGTIMSIRFDANINPALPWLFEPERHTDRAAVGARKMAFYTAKNLSNKPVTGTATYNVTPVQAGQYFVKVDCFCFTEQTLAPGQEVRMPIVYFLDPRIMEDPHAAKIDEITLSYTFYPVDEPQPRS